MNYDWILFDADDTLFDFPAAERAALESAAGELGLDYSEELLALYSAKNRQVWRELERGEIDSAELRVRRFRLLFEELGDPVSSLDPALASRIFVRHLARGTALLAGAQALVTDLSSRYRLALVTNGLAEVQRPRIEASAINGAFESVFISEELGAAKPSRAFFDLVFSALGSPPRERVLLVGDSLTADVRGGLDYGLDTCWFDAKNAGTDLPVSYRITSLEELRAILL